MNCLARGRLVCVAAALAVGVCGCDTAGIQRAYMSLDQQGDRRRQVFYTDSEQINCVAEVASGRRDLTVQFFVRRVASYLQGEADPVPRNDVVWSGEEAPADGYTVVAFGMLNDFVSAQGTASDQPYPPGAYVCAVYLDGALATEIPFEIVYPDCPAAPPVQSQVCRGYYEIGSECTGAFDGQSCECTQAGVWTCRGETEE